MLHPELENQKASGYPAIKALLKHYYSEQGDFNNAILLAEAGGNQSYGFHVTMQGQGKPSFFFKIEREKFH